MFDKLNDSLHTLASADFYVGAGLIAQSTDTPLLRLFNGNSLLDKCGMLSQVAGRQLRQGDAVDCYRNLNKSNCFSIKARAGQNKGLVVGYGQAIVISSPSLVIGEKSRERVLREKCRNVHTYVRGHLVDVIDGDLLMQYQANFKRISYSPFIGGHFYCLSRDEHGKSIPESMSPFDNALLEHVEFAILNGADVFLKMRGLGAGMA